ncbi:hypothetical protein GUJ93_ZPchr0004g39311 [Zizania palustris]|uniref:Uncharacterized protein n=1 Tax=Zizania palustris TaxID=103762 RepID=A0A8J5SF63_ZIZPA|nr:hypothetical protein GUJ93_ZPchr0004g39311 [Zizania palustris]
MGRSGAGASPARASSPLLASASSPTTRRATMSPAAKAATGGNRRPRSAEPCGHREARSQAEGEVGRHGEAWSQWRPGGGEGAGGGRVWRERGR